MSLGSQRQPQVEFHGAYLNAPYYDYGFDVVRPIDTQSPEDFDRYLNFLKAVLKKWRGTIDPKGKFFIVHQHYFEWKFKERQIIPFDGNYFLQFGSKSCQREPTHNVEETYLEIWRLAEEYLGSDIVRRSKCWFSGDQKRDLPDWKPPTDRALREAREAVLGMAEVLDPPAWKLALQVEGVTIDEQPSQVNVFRQDTLMEDVDHSAQDLTLPSINELLAGIGDDSGAPTRTRESAPPPPDREASPRPWRGVLPLLNSLSRNSSRSSIDAENVQSLLSGNFLTAPTSPINPALTRILDSIEVPPNVPHPMRASLDNMFSKLEVNICLEGTLKETECTMSQAIVAELRKRKGLHLGFYDILANEEMRVYLECHENVKEFPALFVEGKLLDLKAAEVRLPYSVLSRNFWIELIVE
ncbi:hypothetical protein EJ08DRAFT_453322 [Tothia fuscella]|uniref:Uncharacterized protein n=1 Tax=Tothia fuscella TaxID=1048955 RepID=A0A9P4NJC8_9PEZI|nr:hypothetical protein EJ08DRAFT_453322 [Tothia fuscella]